MSILVPHLSSNVYISSAVLNSRTINLYINSSYFSSVQLVVIFGVLLNNTGITNTHRNTHVSLHVYIYLCILIALTLLIDLKDWYFFMTGREGIKDRAAADT